ncbi:hypothetical protein [Desulfobacter sp.]|uniref:hypothetical protein n=1 Tax=Desulfobacter sp. TaxID=2294 RepID=UPI0025804B08|nr:hypothetical protein [Desulfobacter sp.]
MLRPPDGIWASLAQVLETEFSKRSGIKLILDLDSAFHKDAYPKLAPEELMADFFPERNARLSPGHRLPLTIRTMTHRASHDCAQLSR